MDGKAANRVIPCFHMDLLACRQNCITQSLACHRPAQSRLPSSRKVVWVSKNPQVTLVRKGAFRRCAAVFLQLGRAPSSSGSVPYNSPTSVFECRVHFCAGHLLAVGVR
jgi:hypothetical protein